MTVKEVEERTGLPRANIRYYESEGLIHPNRGENGYRDYRQEDVDTLLKIKLLRQLGFSLEDIRAIQAGDQELEPALEGRLTALQKERAELDQAALMCRAMGEDHVRYDTLDASVYLGRMEQPERPSLTWKEDGISRPVSLWRRFFARALDLMLYRCLYVLFLHVALRELVETHSVNREVLDVLVCTVLLLLLEPLFLHYFGTTPGKFLFGLRITRSDGSCLGCLEALCRTVGVLGAGLGFQIPYVREGLMLWSCWKAYHGRDLPWETGDQVYGDGSKTRGRFRNRRGSYLRLAGAGALVAVCIGLTIWGAQYALTPVHQNEDRTVEQFVENYNQYSRTLAGPDRDFDRLRTDGTFEEDGSSWTYLMPAAWTGMMGFVTEDEITSLFQLEFQEEDGVLTGISYSYRYHYAPGVSETLPGPTALPWAKTAKLLWCFLYGRGEMSREQLERLIDHFQEFPYLPLAWEQEGISVDYQPKVRGYNKDVLSMSPRPAAEEYLVEAEFFVSLELDV